MTRRVLIAHQSTIPHYRVPFYNALERLRPSEWHFEVAFDSTELLHPRIFREPLQPQEIRFPILEARLVTKKIGSRNISYQRFWRRAASYDLVVVENAVNNLTYPLAQLHQLHGVKYAYWGHGRDREIVSAKGYKAMAERLKLWLSKRADGFFAYTNGIKAYLVANGLQAERVFVLNNTIDIDYQRRVFQQLRSQKAHFRQLLGIDEQQHVLLYVGRFTPNKRLGFLMDAFSMLARRSRDFHLIVVGGGDLPVDVAQIPNVSLLGTIVDIQRLAPVYIASDLFLFPGPIGLGALQALCYDLPVLTVESATHGPEIEYLSEQNSLVLPSTTAPYRYAQHIENVFNKPGQLEILRSCIWPSISHLTIDNMAANFIGGVNTLLS